ncbi:TetR/AcrR family transcriptional regulator [Flexivirga oryzae]|uniref:AcrR family transcriptional regulator n=1 Tax=Flexivirga oryzae TaxID=1794944 RepID=A0A839NC25_9MICO|nr:TetR/AcrR family transcriptional regulator [Flexivirga oryzae]MBB2894767.1 AcrR family transcriptional regulator [Flexivirga oryzae]
MAALRNKTIGDERLLDAARECLLAVGWRRTTMTDVARRAGVSRMSVYRRWPDMTALIGDLMTREWSTVGARLADGDRHPDADGIARAVAAVALEIRQGELFRKIVEVDPELLVPYLLVRRGRTQDTMLRSITSAVSAGQQTGEVREDDAELLARSVLLMATGFVFSAPTMTDENVEESALFDQLVVAVRGYLAP